MYLRSERIVSPQGIIKAILNIEDGKIIDIINYHARVMIDIDVADNLVISDISNAKIDINKATNVDNYLLNIDESQCDLMSFCQFLNKNESYFLADCNKLSKEVFKLIDSGLKLQYLKFSDDSLVEDLPLIKQVKKNKKIDTELKKDIEKAKYEAKSDKVKPNYKKKVKLAVDKVKRKHRREIIKKDIRRQREERYKQNGNK